MAEIQKRWLERVGGVDVERIENVKRSRTTADLSKPPKGDLHTTEGDFEGSLSVFRNNTGTPTFMAGRDGAGRLRCAQFMPIGEMCLTLQNEPGGIETNRWCRVQIECLGFSRKTDKPKWFLGVDHEPLDGETLPACRNPRLLPHPTGENPNEPCPPFHNRSKTIGPTNTARTNRTGSFRVVNRTPFGLWARGLCWSCCCSWRRCPLERRRARTRTR